MNNMSETKITPISDYLRITKLSGGSADLIAEACIARGARCETVIREAGDPFLYTSYMRSVIRSVIWKANDSYIQYARMSKEMEERGKKPSEKQITYLQSLGDRFASVSVFLDHLMVRRQYDMEDFKENLEFMFEQLLSYNPAAEASELREKFAVKSVQDRQLRIIKRRNPGFTDAQYTKLLQSRIDRAENEARIEAEQVRDTIDMVIENLKATWESMLSLYDKPAELRNGKYHGWTGMDSRYAVSMIVKAKDVVCARVDRIWLILDGLDPKWKGKLKASKRLELEREALQVEAAEEQLMPIFTEYEQIMEDARNSGSGEIDDPDALDAARGFGTYENPDITY